MLAISKGHMKPVAPKWASSREIEKRNCTCKTHFTSHQVGVLCSGEGGGYVWKKGFISKKKLGDGPSNIRGKEEEY